jgi:large subunit ribosomal protein L6
MSRIGKRPVPLPKGVTVTSTGSRVSVKGPKGELALVLRPEVSVSVDASSVVVEPSGHGSEANSRAFHGMTRALIANMVVGVSAGFERKLEINGVGYNAKLQGKQIVLALGHAHPVTVDIPATVTVEVPTPTSIIVRGCDKQQVGETAARIRKLRPPEPYKGKGIKYDFEVVRRKAGKAFGSA